MIFFPLKICAIILVFASSARADIQANPEWVRMWNGGYELRISPKGTARSVYQGYGLKCDKHDWDTCETSWLLRINGSPPFGCSNSFTVGAGTSYESLLTQINNRMMTPCQFPTSRFPFTGNEQICLTLITAGRWSGAIGIGGYLVHFRAGPSSCGGGEGQDGGDIKPPVQPVSCQVSPENITIQHPVLDASELNGHRKEVNIHLSCSRDSSVNLRMTGLNNNGLLALSQAGSLSSELTINDVRAQNGITVNNVGTNGVNVTMASTLIKSSNVPFGKYSASAVLQVTIP
ncbi:MrpH family fimbial adhesin [Serratia ureilytica]|uniref:MrpH family fimbial adhesin n=1 Tax=Serratia ureilytica TaxID=300181 RepID=UPI001C0F9324|nr:hypothetical protein [Serratia ureilytica]MBU5413212.1 hypothetical protein [Serratia ureilytica]